MDHFVFFLRHIFGGDLVGSSWAGAGPFGGHCLFEGSAKEAEPQKLEKHRLPTIQPSIFFHLQKNMWISGRVYKWRKNRWLTCIMDSGHVPRLYWKTALFGKDRVCPFQPHFSTSSRWWFQWFFNVHPYLGFDDPIWVSHIFQVGWNSTTNHGRPKVQPRPRRALGKGHVNHARWATRLEKWKDGVDVYCTIHINIYIYIQSHVYTYIYIYLFIYLHIHTHTYIYIYKCLYIYILYKCLYIYIFAYDSIWMFLYSITKVLKYVDC